jgi:hypothetical protein
MRKRRGEKGQREAQALADNERLTYLIRYRNGAKPGSYERGYYDGRIQENIRHPTARLELAIAEAWRLGPLDPGRIVSDEPSAKA